MKTGLQATVTATAVAAASVVFSGLVIEAVLRLYPAIIPLEYAAAFPLPAKQQVAESRDLPIRDQMVEVVRDDGGPELLVHAPNQVRYIAAEEADLEHGAVQVIRQDDEGFCNPQAVDEADVLVIGDSFVWCTSVNSTTAWSAQLDRQIDQSVTQVAMPGRGIHDYIQFLKTYGVEKDPRAVLLVYYEGNDLQNARDYWNWRASRYTGVVKQPTHVVGKARSLIETSGLGSSWAVSFLAVATWQLVREVDVASINARFDIDPGDKAIPFNVRNAALIDVETARDHAAGEVRFDILKSAFLEFAELAELEDFVPIVVYMPSAHSVYRDNVAFEDPEVGKVLHAFSLRQRNFLRTLTADLGMPFIDPTEALADFDRDLSNLLYFPANLHLTPSGHEAIATIVARELDSLHEVIEERPQLNWCLCL